MRVEGAVGAVFQKGARGDAVEEGEVGGGVFGGGCFSGLVSI